MGQEFNKTREEKGYVAALKLYQYRLNEWAGDLCDIMSPKDIMDKTLDIEKELKTSISSGTGGVNPLDQLRELLSETVH